MNAETFALVTAIAGLAITAANFGLFYEARMQVRAAREARKTEGLFTLMEFLHRSEFREARRAVLASEEGTKPDERDAWIVCSSFDFAGLMVEHNLIDRDVFLHYWGPVIPLLAKKIEPFLGATQFGGVPGRVYWKHFVRLIDTCQASVPRAG